MSPISAMLTLMIALAPTPCSTRASVSVTRLSASAQPSEETVKKARPPRNTLRGPHRSPIAAKGSSVATMAIW